jgi:hypothetical protein
MVVGVDDAAGRIARHSGTARGTLTGADRGTCWTTGRDANSCDLLTTVAASATWPPPAPPRLRGHRSGHQGRLSIDDTGGVAVASLPEDVAAGVGRRRATGVRGAQEPAGGPEAERS